MEKEIKIDERQFGCRKQRSTIDAVSKITTKVLDGFRSKEKIATIFFDINKKLMSKPTERRHLNN